MIALGKQAVVDHEDISTCLSEARCVLTCSTFFVFTATLKVSCPKSIAIGGEETLNVSIHVSHSLPVILNASTVVGTHIITSKDQGTEYMWKIRGNDPNLVFNHPVSVTWTATYINTECSGVEYAPLAKKACEAISASASCTTNVLADGK